MEWSDRTEPLEEPLTPLQLREFSNDDGQIVAVVRVDLIEEVLEHSFDEFIWWSVASKVVGDDRNVTTEEGFEILWIEDATTFCVKAVITLNLVVLEQKIAEQLEEEEDDR